MPTYQRFVVHCINATRLLKLVLLSNVLRIPHCSAVLQLVFKPDRLQSGKTVAAPIRVGWNMVGRRLSGLVRHIDGKLGWNSK